MSQNFLLVSVSPIFPPPLGELIVTITTSKNVFVFQPVVFPLSRYESTGKKNLITLYARYTKI